MNNHDVDINSKDKNGDTALHRAASKNDIENVTALLNAGANIDAMNNLGNTPLHVAAQKGKTEAVSTLLNAKANIHARNKNGSTPLHFAALYGHTKIVIALLNTNANANLANNDADTPLHWAARYGRSETVTALLNAGANIHATNNDDETPIVDAFERAHHDIVRLLQARGAVLLAQLPSTQVNPQQSTHTQSVHESLAVATSALYQRYMHVDFHLITDFNESHTKQSRTKKLYLGSDGAYLLTDSDGNVDRKGFIVENAGFNLNNLKKRLHEPSFQQAVLKATGVLDCEAVLSEINRFASTLDEKDLVEGAAKRCLARLPSITFTDSRCGITLYQALICVWLGLNDTHAIQGKILTSKDIKDRKKNFVQHLYQMQRGYNLNQQGIDDQGPDKIICIPGHFNQLIDTLNGRHDLVATVIVNAGTVALKAAALANDAFLTLEQVTQTQYAPFWTKENGVPEELLPHLQSTIEKPLRAEFDQFKDHHEFEEWITSALSVNVLGCTPPPKSVLALQEKILANMNNHDVNINSKDKNGDTALHRAVWKNDAKSVTALLNTGANIEATNTDGNTPLLLAAKCGYTEIIMALINAKANIHATNKYGSAPLHGAALNRHIESVTALLNAGANIDAKDIDGYTPLHLAALCGYTETVTTLLNARANIHMTSNTGNTALHTVARSGRTEIVTALLNAGANIDVTNSYGSMPLHRAAENGKTETVIALLNAKANIHAPNSHRETPLHKAAEYGQTKTITALLDAGSDIHAADNRSNTPLHSAARYRNTETVTALLNAGADIYAANSYDETPIIVAFESGHHDIVQLLQARGAVLPLHLQLPGGEVNPQQSTHTQSVHESLAIAASALYQRYIHVDFHLMADFNEAHAKQSRTKKLYLSDDGAYLLTDSDGNVERKGFIAENAGFNLNNLNKHLHEPSFQQAVLKTTGILDSEAVLSEINRFASTLDEKDPVEGAAKRCLVRLPSIDFTDSRSKVSLYQALICVWLGLNDTHAIPGKTLTPEDIKDRKKNFVQHLYQMQRGYNLNQQGVDNEGEDKTICIPGHFNQLIDTLNGGHDLVNTLMVNAGTVALKAAALANEAFLTLEQAIQRQYAPLWTEKDGVPEKLLPHLQAAIEKPLRAEFDGFKQHHDFEKWINDALSANVLGCTSPPKSVLALQEKILTERKALAESKTLEAQMAELEIESASPSTRRRFR